MIFNRIKTVILLGALTGLLLFLGNLIGGTSGIQFALIFSLVMNGIAYFFSDKIVLSIYGAKPLDIKQYDWVYGIVEELARTMRMPMPKLWLIQTPMANAFATGRNPAHASVAVTTGILRILDKDELRGVLAHELSHVKNRDILVSSVAAVLASAIGYLAYWMRNMAFWGSMSGDRKRGGNSVLFMFIVSLLMPLAATLIQLAISRSREYLADETGADCCQDPLALASALEKLQNHIPDAHLDSNETQKAASAHMFIVNPFLGSGFLNLFSTHPPMKARIQRLRDLYAKKFRNR